MNKFANHLMTSLAAFTISGCAIGNNATKKDAEPAAEKANCAELIISTRRLVGDVNDLMIHTDYVRTRGQNEGRGEELQGRITVVKIEFEKLEREENRMMNACVQDRTTTAKDFHNVEQLQSATYRLRLRMSRLLTGQPIQF